MAQGKKRGRNSKRAANRTRNWLMAGAAGAMLLIVALLALASRQDESPGQQTFDPAFEPLVSGAARLEVLPDDVIDYGDVKLGTTITTVYTVRNVGDAPLAIYGEPRVELIEGC
jgi:hypothetical protein